MTRFIVDSTFGIEDDYCEKHGVETVSLTVSLNGMEYSDGKRADWASFYADYTRIKSAAKTSQPSPNAFMSAIEKCFSDGADGVIILTIGDRLSGTVGSARIAALQFPERRIAVINTESASISACMLLDELVAARDGGADLDELVKLAEQVKGRLSIMFIAATLTELARGGRVNKLISHIGTLLNVKPVFEFANNNINILTKSIGTRLALSAAVSRVPKDFKRIGVCYIHDDKNVVPLKEQLKKQLGLTDIEVKPVCPVLGAHIGVGTVGIGIMRK